MMKHARGTFEVKLTPRTDEQAGDPTVGRMSIEKEFQGDLKATSKGQMLTAMTDVKGSAGYVAMERVDGTLDGRSGSFALQHSGTMTRGEGQLTITVVPDSGTGELAGLSGKMSINIVEGQHSYDFEYALDQPV
jgi:flagellar basal body rod protein FlgG